MAISNTEEIMRSVIKALMQKELNGSIIVIITGKKGVRDFIKSVCLEFTGSKVYTRTTVLRLFKTGWITPLGKGLYQIQG